MKVYLVLELGMIALYHEKSLGCLIRDIFGWCFPLWGIGYDVLLFEIDFALSSKDN